MSTVSSNTSKSLRTKVLLALAILIAVFGIQAGQSEAATPYAKVNLYVYNGSSPVTSAPVTFYKDGVNVSTIKTNNSGLVSVSLQRGAIYRFVVNKFQGSRCYAEVVYQWAGDAFWKVPTSGSSTYNLSMQTRLTRYC